jgi:hypothetical protein
VLGENKRKKIKLTLVLLASGFFLLPFFSHDWLKINKSIVNYGVPLDIFYSTRIFSVNESLFQLGNQFIDNKPFVTRSPELLSIGEFLNRLFFKFSNLTISQSYYWWTYILLCFWVLWIIKVCRRRFSYSSLAFIFVVFWAMYLFFSNNRWIDNEYPFARLVNPQFSGLIWIIFIWLTLMVFETFIKYRKNWKFTFSLLIVSNLSYLTYTFLYLAIFGTLLAFTIFACLKYGIGKTRVLVFVTSLSVPFPLFLSLSRIQEQEFTEAAIRMGLIDGRFPGALYAFCLSMLTIVCGTLSKKFLKLDRDTESTITILQFASIGTLIASQSNVITGKSIQFSDHFDLFANINAMLMICALVNSYCLRIEKIFELKLPMYTRVLLGLILFSFSASYYPWNIIFDGSKVKSISTSTPENLVIVDLVGGAREGWPIYSSDLILYDSSMAYYGYSNFELLERYFISTGCKKSISESEVNSIFVYREQATRQRADRIMEVFQKVRFEALGKKVSLPLLDSANSRRNEIQSEIESVIEDNVGANCLELARAKGAKSIYFDSLSHWKELLQKNDKNFYKLGETGFFVYRI